jgi:anthranilate phosphoribosyltransferase
VIKEAIAKLVEGQHLTEAEAQAAMSQIMDGEATPAQIGAFLAAMCLKGETVAELVGCAGAMRASAVKVVCQHSDLVDTCGTGGDGVGTFNVSTTVALMAAGAGLTVAKHGNRSVSSRCGSADLLEALGVSLDLGPEEIARCIDTVGIGFLFAPRLHPAMKHAIAPRRELGIRTIFNLLGPLTNPASASIQLLGVYSPDLTEPLAQVLRTLGTKQALVVHGHGGLDELSTTGVNKVTRLNDGEISTFYLDPASLGLPLARLDELKGGSVEENVYITMGLLRGEEGPRRDIVLLNAAAILVAAGKAADFPSGLALARESLDSGQALKKLEQLIRLSQRLAGKHAG